MVQSNWRFQYIHETLLDSACGMTITVFSCDCEAPWSAFGTCLLELREFILVPISHRNKFIFYLQLFVKIVQQSQRQTGLHNTVILWSIVLY